jgi:hypothetical protein
MENFDDFIDYDEEEEPMPFPWHISDIIFRKLSFWENIRFILKLNSPEAYQLFMDTHPMGDLEPGDIVEVQYGDIKQRGIVTRLFYNGRCAEVHTETNFKYDYLIRDSSELSVIRRRAGKEIFSDWERRFWVVVINSQLVIIEAESKLKHGDGGYFMKNGVGFIREVHLPEALLSLKKANEWRESLEALKPGDKVTIMNDDSNKYQSMSTFNVEHVFYDQEHIDSIPEWIVSTIKAKPFHFISTKGGVLLPFMRIKSIIPSHSIPCLVLSATCIIHPENYMVIHVTGLPIVKVLNTSDNGYKVQLVDSRTIWNLHKNYPAVEVFKTRKGAEDYKNKKLEHLATAMGKIRPGDLIIKRLYKNELQKSRYFHVKRITCNNTSDTEDESEPESALFNLTNHYYMDDKNYIEPKNIQDIILLKDIPFIYLDDIGSCNNAKIKVMVGFTLDIKIKNKSLRRVKVERIVYNGVVIDGMFYFVDKVQVVISHFENIAIENTHIKEKMKKDKEIKDAKEKMKKDAKDSKEESFDESKKESKHSKKEKKSKSIKRPLDQNNNNNINTKKPRVEL